MTHSTIFSWNKLVLSLHLLGWCFDGIDGREVSSQTTELEPSTSPSVVSSIESSSIPTALLSTFEPSSSPTMPMQLESPSSSPIVSFKTFQPSQSIAPSDFPSLVPSITPSQEPSTSNPSLSPTERPSTSAPTNQPTFAPSTATPTESPSNAPSGLPSLSPSSMPSSSPTDSCHDVASYRSPINGFSCSDHNGTDCIQWRHLGLSVDQVESLIDNCPISCHVDCGTSLRFGSTFSFKLWNIDTFLSPSAVTAMNDVAVDYLTNYVSALEPESTFFLDETVLIAQHLAGNDPVRHLRTLQQQQIEVDVQPSRALRIDLELRGYAIGLDQETIYSGLREGLFTPEFTRSLQRSGDSTFANAKVDVVGSQRPTDSLVQDADEGISPGGISAAILACIAVIAAGVMYLFYRKRKSIRKKGFIQQDGIFLDTPASPNYSIASPTSAYSMGVGSNMASRMARIVRSFSPRSGDDEEATRSADSSDSGSNDLMKDSLGQVGMIAKDDIINEEGESDASDDVDATAVHPYAGIIPPMIVIDSIESDEEGRIRLAEKSGSSKKTIKDVVPSLRLTASSDLVAAISDSSKPFDPDALSSFIRKNNLVSHNETEYQQLDVNLQICDGGSFNMFTSDDDDGDEDEDHKSTTESLAESSDDLFDRLRKGGISDDDNTIPAGASNRSVDVRPRHPFGLSLLTRPPRMPSDSSVRTSPKSVPSSPHIPRDKAYVVDDQSSDDNTSKERASKKDAPSFLHSLWSKSPSGRVPTSAKSDASVDSNNKRRKFHRRTSSKGSIGTQSDLEEEGSSLLTFHAPKGKLGLVLECSTESTPIVAKVKDYSPLLDQVLPGDKIVMIDSTSTDKMSMHEVLNLLEGKTNRATSVRLKVYRAHSDSLDGASSSSVPHARSPTISHLSVESFGTMSDHESPIQYSHKKSFSNTHPSVSQQLPFSAVKRSHSDTDDIPPIPPPPPPPSD